MNKMQKTVLVAGSLLFVLAGLVLIDSGFSTTNRQTWVRELDLGAVITNAKSIE
jgi:hypothetical protein